ncbi:MAG TPA: hypothetical protein VGI81_25075 [Tepidisphaeraceae bacterium]
MESSKLREVLPRVPATQRFASLARLLRGLSALTQIGLMIALLVMWKRYHVPLATAFERCFVAGVIVYVTLGTAASILMSLARLQPFQMLLRHLLAVASIVIFGALHYVYGLGIFHSALAWAVIYFAARVLVGRIERRAMVGFRAGP